MCKLKLKKSILALAVTGLVTGCGGSNSSSGLNDSSGGGNTSTTESFTVKAIDGYLESAEVYVDTNKNDKVDSEDVKLGETDKNGELAVDVKYKGEQFIIKAIAGTTIDQDNGVVNQGFELAAPPGIEVITPFTHMVALQAQADANSADVDDIISTVATELGIDVDILKGDFISLLKDEDKADEAKVATAVARSVVTEIQEKGESEQEVAFNELKTVVEKVKIKAEETLENAQDPLEQAYEVDDNGDVIVAEKPAGWRFSEALLDSDAFRRDWAMYVVHPDASSEYIEWGWAKFQGAADTREFCFVSKQFPNDVPDQTAPLEHAQSNCSTVEINDKGDVVFSDGVESWSSRLVYFNQAEDPHRPDSTLTTMVLISENGEFYYLDNSSELSVNDTDDFTTEGTIGTWYQVMDDDPGLGVDLLMGKMTYQADGVLALTDLNAAEQESISTTWSIESVGSGSDPIRVRAIDGTEEIDARHQYLFRTDGTIRLIRDKKNASNYDALVIEVADESVAKRILETWEDRVQL